MMTCFQLPMTELPTFTETEIQFEAENLLEMDGNLTYMGIAKMKTNMNLTNDNNFQHYVNLMN